MTTLGITLARGGSKGVPRKNVRVVAGKPLLAWTVEEALKCTLLDRYVVSTDDDEVATVAKHFGAEVVIRPPAFCEDDTPSIDALLYTLSACEKKEQYDIVADIRCTNPLKTAFDIDSCIDKLVKTGADVVCGVTQLEDHHPARIKRIFHDRLVDFAWPEPESGNRQDLVPKAYIRNGSIYVVRSVALEQGIHFQGTEEIRPYIMPLERSVNVDTELDLVLVEALLERR